MSTSTYGTLAAEVGPLDPAPEVALPLLADTMFRQIMRSFPSGVSVVTTTDVDGAQLGFTANSVVSVSRFPPMLLVCAANTLFTLGAIRRVGVFAINLLDESGESLAKRFASRQPDKFRDVDHDVGQLGVPLLRQAVAHAECTVARLIEVGDHVIILGTMMHGHVSAQRDPLLHCRGKFFSWPFGDDARPG